MENQFSINQKFDRFKREQENKLNEIVRALRQVNVLAPAPQAVQAEGQEQAAAAAQAPPQGFVLQAVLAAAEEEPVVPAVEPFTFDPPARSVSEVMQLPQFRGNNARDRIMKFGPNTTYANIAEEGADEQEWIIIALDAVDVSEIRHEAECVVCVDQKNTLIDWEKTLKKLKKLVKIRNYSGDSITRAINRLVVKYAPTMKASLEGKDYNECAQFLINTQSGMNRKAFKQKAILSVVRYPQEPIIVPLTKIERMLEELYPTRPPGGAIENPEDPVAQQRRVIHTGNISTKNRQLIKGLISFVPDPIAVEIGQTMQQDFNEGREPDYEDLKRRVIEHEQNHNFVNTHALKYGRKIDFKKEQHVEALLNYNDLEEEVIAMRSKKRREYNSEENYDPNNGNNVGEDENPNPNHQHPNQGDQNHQNEDNNDGNDDGIVDEVGGLEGLQPDGHLVHVNYVQDENGDYYTQYVMATQELAEVNQTQGYNKTNSGGYMQTVYPGVPPPIRGKNANRSRGSYRGGPNRGGQNTRGKYQPNNQRTDSRQSNGNSNRGQQNKSGYSQTKGYQGNNPQTSQKRDGSVDRKNEVHSKENDTLVLKEILAILAKMTHQRSRSTTPTGSHQGSKNTSRSNSYERYQNKKKQNSADKDKKDKKDNSSEKKSDNQKTTSYPSRINATDMQDLFSKLNEEEKEKLSLFVTSIQHMQQ